MTRRVRYEPAALRGAWWAIRALYGARRQLRRRDFRDLRVPAPPAVDPATARGVGAILQRQPGTCLTRAAVRQAWHAARGEPRDLVIGVQKPSNGFKAHAWLEGDPEATSGEYVELARRAAS